MQPINVSGCVYAHRDRMRRREEESAHTREMERDRASEREEREHAHCTPPSPAHYIFLRVDGVAPPSTMMPPGFPKGVVAGRSHLERLVFEGGQIIVGHVDFV